MTKVMMPYPDKLSFFEKLQLYLFDDPDMIPEYHAFTPKQLEMKKRYATVFSYWVDKPTLSDRKIINFMVDVLGVGKAQAFKDMHQVKILLGNVRNAAKEWQRYKVISMLDRAYELAEAQKDPKAIIMAADKLGKYTQLDKEDAIKIPYEDIVPQNFEITGDVSVLNIKPIANLKEVQTKLRQKYGGAIIDDVEEAEISDE